MDIRNLYNKKAVNGVKRQPQGGEKTARVMYPVRGGCRDGDSVGQAGWCVHLLIDHTRDSDMASWSHVSSSGPQDTEGSSCRDRCWGQVQWLSLSNSCPSSTEATYPGPWPAVSSASPPPAHPAIQRELTICRQWCWLHPTLPTAPEEWPHQPPVPYEESQIRLFLPHRVAAYLSPRPWDLHKTSVLFSGTAKSKITF